MHKIPVGQSIAHTYGFAFGRYLPILGAIWLPVVILGAFAYFVFLPDMANFPSIMQQAAQHAPPDPHMPVMPAALGRMMSHAYLLDLVELVVFSVIAVGVTREALGMRKGPWFVYLSFGKAELLIMAAYFLVFVIFVVALVALVVVSGIVGLVGVLAIARNGAHGVSPATTAASGGLIFLVGVLIVFAVTYFFTRLTYLIVPATVAEGRFGLGRSWELTRGNFWRIFVIALATILPLVVLETIFMGIVYGPTFLSFFMELQKHPDAANAQLAVMMRGMSSYMIYAFVIGLLIGPIVYGLIFGQAAFAYRALVSPADGDGMTH